MGGPSCSGAGLESVTERGARKATKEKAANFKARTGPARLDGQKTLRLSDGAGSSRIPFGE